MLQKAREIRPHGSRVRILMAIALLLFSLGSWSQTSFQDVTGQTGFVAFGSSGIYGSGVAAADYDGDGDIDLFVPTAENQPNQLYRNMGNGRFEEIAAELGIADRMQGRLALWFDFNGDHLLDLFVAGDCYGRSDCPDSSIIKLYQQLSPSNFVDVTAESGLTKGITFSPSELGGGIAAGDLNNDGLLDLMVTYWNKGVYLYLNHGNGKFSDIGASHLTGEVHFYLQPLLYDFDKNGFPDIFLNVDGGENLFWLNQGGLQFSEVGRQLELNTSFNEMGMALGDYDNDQDMDIYISNVAGGASYNVFFQNESKKGTLEFREVARELGVSEGGWGWGVSFLDADNDGYLDLAETNGFTTGWEMPSKFWINNQKGGFTDISKEVGFTDPVDGTTLIALDYDRDGDLDLVESLKKKQGQNIDLRLLENQVQQSDEPGNYLVVKPRMVGKNHFGIGSTVRARLGEVIISRPILAGTSYYGQEPAEAFFGLGQRTHVDSVWVEWPGGSRSVIRDIAANQILTVTDKEILHPPTNFRITRVDLDSISLAWNHLTTRETGFSLQRSLTSSFDSYVTFLIDRQQKTFTDRNLQQGITYYYRIQALSEDSTSDHSRVVSGLTQQFVGRPTDLEVKGLDHDGVILTWVDNADNENAFIVERSDSENFQQIVEFELEAGTTEFADSGLPAKTGFYYRVKAINDKGHSAYSDPLNITTLDFIAKPDHLTGTQDDKGQIRLNWTDHSSNETGFIIERSIDENFLYSRKFYLGPNSVSFVDSEIVPGIPFFYRVRAHNPDVYSEFSNTFAITVGQDQEQEGLVIFPNPAREQINVKFLNDYLGLVQLTVTSNTGQFLFHNSYEKGKALFETSFSLNVSSGIYLLNLSAGNRTYQRKIILLR